MTDSGSLPRFVREALRPDELARADGSAVEGAGVELGERSAAAIERSLLALEDALSDVVEVEAVHIKMPASLLQEGPARLASFVLEAPQRYAPFFSRIAQFFDLSEDAVIAELTRLREPVKWQRSRFTGVRTLAIQTGPAFRSTKASLLLIDAGMMLVESRSWGSERILVIEGSYEDASGVQHRAGDLCEWSGAAGYSLRAGNAGRCLLASLVLGRGAGAWIRRAFASFSR